MYTNELIQAWIDSGHQITKCETKKMPKAIRINKYTAWGRTAKIGHLGRKYNHNTTKIAGSAGSKAAFG